MTLEGLPIMYQYNDWCKGITQGVGDAEGVNSSVEEMSLPDKAMENDEQKEHVQELSLNEPISTRLLSYELNKRWEIDEEIRRKTIDVSFFFIIFVVVHILHI